MHKVLIVDDDWLILEDICKLIRWETCGFQTPMAAQGAKEALEILEQNPAELVITDISMPEISGVELILRAKELYPDTVFAVLSNYDDFLYVKEAMKAGAVEYLLKYEIEPENLVTFLKQMAGEIRAKKQTVQERRQLLQMRLAAQHDLRSLFWQQLYRNQLEDRQMYDQARSLDIPVKGGAWIPVIAEFAGKDKRRDIDAVWEKTEAAAARAGGGCRIYGAPVIDNLLFLAVYIPEVSFLLVTNLMTRILRILQESFLCADMPVFLCAGRICMQLKEIPEGLRGLQEYTHLRFYRGYRTIMDGISWPADTGRLSGAQFPEGGIPEGKSDKGRFPFEQWEELLSAMTAGGPEETEERLEDFRKAVFRQEPPEQELKREVSAKLRVFRDSMEKQEVRLGSLEKADTCTGFFELLTELVRECSRANVILHKISRREIREAAAWLYRHYQEAVTLNRLAEKACMSRAYFCKVFKDEAGINYTDFLNQIRIGHAMQLLRKSSLHTREVADRTGFSDYRYFCRLFKQATGKTCGEYRKSCLKEKACEKKGGDDAAHRPEV